MRFSDYLKIALKNLLRQKARSVLTIVAIVIGSLAVIILVALVIGASNMFIKQVESMGALSQITVLSSPDMVDNMDPFGGGGGGGDSDKKLTDESIKMVEKVNHITEVVGIARPFELQNIRLKDGDEKKYRINNIEAYKPSGITDKDILAGRNLKSGDSTGKILIGSSYAEKFGYGGKEQEIIGKKVILTTYKGYRGEGADIPEPNQDSNGDNKAQDEKSTDLEAEIVGVTTPGMGSENLICITLDWAKKIMTTKYWKPDEEAQKKLNESKQQYNSVPMKLYTDSDFERKGYSSLIAGVDDTANVEKAAEDIKKLGFGAATAKDFLDAFMRIFKILGYILGGIGAISLGVAAIGIINTMVMATLERTREIGVMRACGARKSTVRRLFTFEAAFLGFLGGFIGILIAFLLSFIGNIVLNNILEEQGMSITNIITLPWWLIFGALGLTTILGFVSGLYPAARAARLDPVEALRYE